MTIGDENLLVRKLLNTPERKSLKKGQIVPTGFALLQRLDPQEVVVGLSDNPDQGGYDPRRLDPLDVAAISEVFVEIEQQLDGS